MSQIVNDRIQQLVDENDIVLFMKGEAAFPRCGFSAVPVQILSQLGVPFKDVNVLEDHEIWEGVKVFSDWPTIPQLYIKGEFIGGGDIVRDMYEAGELQDMLQDKGIMKAA